jgi:hypothetical protein
MTLSVSSSVIVWLFFGVAEQENAQRLCPDAYHSCAIVANQDNSIAACSMHQQIDYI